MNGKTVTLYLREQKCPIALIVSHPSSLPLARPLRAASVVPWVGLVRLRFSVVKRSENSGPHVNGALEMLFCTG